MAKFVPIMTYMFQHNPSSLKNMSPSKQAKILECATHMIKCNVSFDNCLHLILILSSMRFALS